MTQSALANTAMVFSSDSRPCLSYRPRIVKSSPSCRVPRLETCPPLPCHRIWPFAEHLAEYSKMPLCTMKTVLSRSTRSLTAMMSSLLCFPSLMCRPRFMIAFLSIRPSAGTPLSCLRSSRYSPHSHSPHSWVDRSAPRPGLASDSGRFASSSAMKKDCPWQGTTNVPRSRSSSSAQCTAWRRIPGIDLTSLAFHTTMTQSPTKRMMSPPHELTCSTISLTRLLTMLENLSTPCSRLPVWQKRSASFENPEISTRYTTASSCSALGHIFLLSGRLPPAASSMTLAVTKEGTKLLK
mmetsp:Transcript_16221/g.39542  ORF Transcript_16221/g.39542 Transcript_16221/m.39542 type:complete len:295 (-) Transcript_16221:260-1144(-)